MFIESFHVGLMDIENLELKKRFFQTLHECQRRQYAALEAQALGHGGQRAVSQTFGIHVDTVCRGMRELTANEHPPPGHIRKPGGGRKKMTAIPQLVQTFQQVIENETAGLPTNEQTRWVGLHPGQICDKMAHEGVEMSRYVAAEFLAFCGFRKRRYAKRQCVGHSGDRDAQFQKIARFREVFAARDLPIRSIDTKKKELLGHFDRGDSFYGRNQRRVNDHEFASASTGVVIPHGIYDVVRNHGYITLGTSKDTSEFVCDNLLWYWQQELQWQDPQVDVTLLLCDGGGANHCRHHLVKWDFFQLAQRLGIHLLIAHYPAYCSKWNPIEHRLFCHLQRAWAGAIFHTIDLVKELALTTSTQTGLTVSVRINTKALYD